MYIPWTRVSKLQQYMEYPVSTQYTQNFHSEKYYKRNIHSTMNNLYTQKFIYRIQGSPVSIE